MSDSRARRIAIKVGDVVRMRKPHPCGCSDWRVTRVGMDVGLECQGCSHRVMMRRAVFEKNYRCHLDQNNDPAPGNRGVQG